MKNVLNINRIGAAFGVIGLAALLIALPSTARADNNNRAPDVSGVSTDLAAPADKTVAFHVYAEGVQIYQLRNIGTPEAPNYSWVFTGPEAVLFDADGNVVGIHYANEGNPARPAWESSSGSKVVGARIALGPVPNAIPWLLLGAVSAEGPGIFHRVTHIQRVYTTGGLAPTTDRDAAHEGNIVRVPYTAEYYFYR